MVSVDVKQHVYLPRSRPNLDPWLAIDDLTDSLTGQCKECPLLNVRPLLNRGLDTPPDSHSGQYKEYPLLNKCGPVPNKPHGFCGR